MFNSVFKAALLLLALSLPINTALSKTVEVGLLLDFSGEEFIPLLQDLSSEIKAVVGSDAEVNFNPEYQLANGFDPNLAKKQYETLLKSDVDIILAFGPTNNNLITSLKSFPKPTIPVSYTHLTLPTTSRV